MDLALLEQVLAARGEPAYRARQVWEWGGGWMPAGAGRRSLCPSSQSGCPLTCTFCATGQMTFGRNLTASEMLDQALHFRRVEAVHHAVFMGMGEPFLNYDEVIAAARRLPDVGITHRRTTISTVGWLPGLPRFVGEVEEPIRRPP